MATQKAAQKATQKTDREPRADETTGKEGLVDPGQPTIPTPGQAEGDRETVEEDLRQKQRGKHAGGSYND